MWRGSSVVLFWEGDTFIVCWWICDYLKTMSEKTDECTPSESILTNVQIKEEPKDGDIKVGTSITVV